VFNRKILKVFVTYLRGALYVHPLWFYKHQHDNRVRSKLLLVCQRWSFRWRFWFVPSVPPIHKHPVSWNCAYSLRMELSDGCFPNLARNCRWTIVPRQSFLITLYSNVKGKHKFVPVNDMKAYRGSKCMAPLILHIDVIRESFFFEILLQRKMLRYLVSLKIYFGTNHIRPIIIWSE